MRRRLMTVLVAAALLVSITTAADAEEVWGGHTEAEWVVIIALTEGAAPEPTWGGLTASAWRTIADALAAQPVSKVATDPLPDREWPLDVEQAIVDAATKWGLSSWEMAEIVRCESSTSGFATAVSPTSDYGLFQHHSRYAVSRFAAIGADFWSSWDDPYVNADAAGYYRTQLGRWGGSAGWVCASKVGLW